MKMNEISKIKNKKILLLLSLLLFIAAGTAIFGCYFARSHKALAQERDSLTATGTIEAKTAMASFKLPGRIETLTVDEGSAVKEGQTLGTLESNEIAANVNRALGAQDAAQGLVTEASNAVKLAQESVEAAINQAQAKVNEAEVAVRNSKQLYDRVKFLHDNGAASDKELDDITDKYEAAQHELKYAEGKLEEAKANRNQVEIAQAKYKEAVGKAKEAEGAVEYAQAVLDNIHLTAPISGFITQKMLEQGEMVNAGTPVFEITDLEHPYVKVYISEKKIGRVKLNQDVEVRVDSFPGKVFKGKVVWIKDAGEFAVKKAINEQYDHDIRSFEVKIDLSNPDLVLKTGMTARVKILEER